MDGTSGNAAEPAIEMTQVAVGSMQEPETVAKMMVALPFQIYRLTHSATLVGLLGLFELGPMIVVSLAVLLVLSTPWADVLKSLQAVGVPQIFVLLLSMTYRYIFLLAHVASATFMAKQSRTVGRTDGALARRWLAGWRR